MPVMLSICVFHRQKQILSCEKLEADTDIHDFRYIQIAKFYKVSKAFLNCKVPLIFHKVTTICVIEYTVLEIQFRSVNCTLIARICKNN